jgi:endonuclease YncB( thermonuclease family)
MDGTTWRLWGIDAPESKQWCGDYPAGALASEALRHLMAGHAVACESRGTDRYGRTIGLCRADGEDLGKGMVAIGMAWAFVRYSHDYVEVEQRARSEQLGIHARACTPAWEWRAQQRQ